MSAGSWGQGLSENIFGMLSRCLQAEKMAKNCPKKSQGPLFRVFWSIIYE
jgi:hypothetical protein